MQSTIKKPTLQQQGTLQSSKELERELIKSMTGNYKVSFKFAETFSPIKDYEYHDRHFSQAKEVAFIIEESENKIAIQHILFVGKHQIKHWRQDWLYENRDLLTLVKDHEWKKTTLSVEEAKGTWTQKVYQVDDCPRYQGYGSWVHINGRHYWESTADAALPRREISTAARTDYNILRRHSRIEIFNDGGWMIEQDNEKIYRDKNDEEHLICMEKGLERFTPKPYDASKIMTWWNKREAFWKQVRELWLDFIDTQDTIKINDDEGLYTAQFELAEKFEGTKYDSEKVQMAIKTLMRKHVENFDA